MNLLFESQFVKGYKGMPRFNELQCYQGIHDIIQRNAYDEAVFAVVAMQNELQSRREEIIRIEYEFEKFVDWWQARTPTTERISASERFTTLERDGFKCRYCGRSPRTADVTLHVDHIISRKEGGDNSPPNRVTACQDCNLGKGARLLKNLPYDLTEDSQDSQSFTDDSQAF